MAGETKFVNVIEKFTHIVGLRGDTVIRKLAFDAFDGLLRRSPVDTGRFRASWRLGINRVNESVSPERTRASKRGGKSAGSSAEIGEQVKAFNAKFGDTVHITNNLPYAQALEDRHSNQAPAGVLEITFFELTFKLNKTLALAKIKVPDVRS